MKNLIIFFLTNNHKEYNNAVSENFSRKNLNEDKINSLKMDLKKKDKDMQLKSWNQFYKNFVIKAFEMTDKEYVNYLKSIRCPFGFIGKASKVKEVYESIIQIKGLDEELKKKL